MTRYLILTAAFAVVAGCGTRNERTTDTAAGGVAPATGGMSDTSMRGTTGGTAGTSTTGTTGGMRDTGMMRGDTGMRDTSGMAGRRGTTGTTRGTTRPPGGTGATAENQTQSGVTNTKTGQSTLGPGVKQLEPTQGKKTVNRETKAP
jgi:hypothetical protein